MAEDQVHPAPALSASPSEKPTTTSTIPLSTSSTSPPSMVPSTPGTSSDHTQFMTFDDYVEWHNGSGPGSHINSKSNNS